MIRQWLTWMAWDLFLAAIPVALAYAMPRLWTRCRTAPGRWVAVAVAAGVLWFIFLPNTCYLITEWRHFFALLESHQYYLRWTLLGDKAALIKLILYSMYFFIFSGLGMLAFALALRPVAALLRRGGRAIWGWGLPCFPLVSLGVYLGLNLRFNSWDLLHRPEAVLTAMRAAVANPLLLAFILAFGGFLWLAYLALDIWVDGLLARCRRADEAAADARVPRDAA